MNKIKFFLQKIICISCILLIPSCATQYRSNNIITGGGYNIKQIDATHYEVKYKANAFSNLKRAHDFSLLKSSQIVLENKQNTFEVMPQLLKYIEHHGAVRGGFLNIEYEVKIIVNLKPKNQPELSFDASAICQIISGNPSQEGLYPLTDFREKVECGKEVSAEIFDKNTKKLNNYYNLFEEILSGDRIVE